MCAKSYRYIVDLDGTIYHNATLLPYAMEFISHLVDTGTPFVFFTNSPQRSPEELAQKLQTMGLPVTAQQVLTAGCVALAYLQKHCTTPNATVFVLGTQSLKQRFRDAGFQVVDGMEPLCQYVIIGFDPGCTFADIASACHHVYRGATLIATNSDESIPCEQGLTPHTGALIAAVECATKTKALVLGKPDAFTFEVIRTALHGNNLCMIGDRLDTDMKFGKDNGIDAYLMLTGITSRAEMEALQGMGLFDCSYNHLGELLSDHFA